MLETRLPITASVVWGNVPTGVSTSAAVALLLADPASLRLFAGEANCAHRFAVRR